MKFRILSLLVPTLILILVLAIGTSSYLVGYQDGRSTPRDFVKGYTILTPDPIKAQPSEIDTSDLKVASYNSVRDIKYGNDSNYNKLDIYLPTMPLQGNSPVMVFIHGAGTSNVSKGERPSEWTIALLCSGITVVQIDYRPFYILSGSEAPKGFPFPSQIDDCKTAIRFIRANASKYKLDPNNIGVMGESFGGYLAALVGTTGEIVSFGEAPLYPDRSSEVNAVCCISGMTDMRIYVNQANAHRFALGYDWPELDSTGKFYIQPMDASQKEQSSPVFHVDPKDPPFLIVQGFDDPSVPPYQGDLLFVKLRNSGVDAKCLLIPGGSHGGPPLSTPSTRKAVSEFLCKHLIR